MTNIAIISDTHFGVRNGSNLFLDNQKAFLDTIFFPTLEQNNIKTIIHLGDLVDKRKSVDFVTSNRLKTDFLNKLRDLNITTHIITGNHDCFYKDTNEINALTELIEGRYSNIKIYTEATEIEVDDTSILLIPWINSSNQHQTMGRINSSTSFICMGHLELIGFEMYKGYISDHGMDTKIFDKFDLVLSGHYHQISKKNNVHYVGAPYHMTWADYENPRGFHLLNLESLNLTFIENPYSVYTKVTYDDTKFKSVKSLLNTLSEQDIKNKYCKLIIAEKTKDSWLDTFINQIQDYQPYDLKIIEQSEIYVPENDVDQTEDTLTILKKTISDIDADISKPDLEKLMIELYVKANEMDV